MNLRLTRELLRLAANMVVNVEVFTDSGRRPSLQKDLTACSRSSGIGSIVFACTQHSSAHQNGMKLVVGDWRPQDEAEQRTSDSSADKSVATARQHFP